MNRIVGSCSNCRAKRVEAGLEQVKALAIVTAHQEHRAQIVFRRGGLRIERHRSPIARFGCGGIALLFSDRPEIDMGGNVRGIDGQCTATRFCRPFQVAQCLQHQCEIDQRIGVVDPYGKRIAARGLRLVQSTELKQREAKIAHHLCRRIAVLDRRSKATFGFVPLTAVLKKGGQVLPGCDAVGPHRHRAAVQGLSVVESARFPVNIRQIVQCLIIGRIQPQRGSQLDFGACKLAAIPQYQAEVCMGAIPIGVEFH